MCFCYKKNLSNRAVLNFLGMFEASAVNSNIVSAALSGTYKTTGAKAVPECYICPAQKKFSYK